MRATRNEFQLAAMVLKAHEDKKTYRGAMIASDDDHSMGFAPKADTAEVGVITGVGSGPYEVGTG